MMLFLSLLCLMATAVQAQNQKFCSPVTSNMNQADFPELSQEFQTRMEISLTGQSRVMDVMLLYNRFDKQGEITYRQHDGRFIQKLLYRSNEFINIIAEHTCEVKRLNETKDNVLFGIMPDTERGGYNMLLPESVFHFNNGYPHRKEEDTEHRRIPVTQYKSCQDWPELKANAMITYYFKKPDYNLSVNYFPEKFKQTPVACVVEGLMTLDNGTAVPFKNEYNFFEFRTLVERKPELNTFPSHVYCPERQFETIMPKIPNSYSFYQESITKNFKGVLTTHFFYSYDWQAVRVNSLRVNSLEDTQEIKIVQDFYSGVGYIIPQGDQKKCELFPIGTKNLDIYDETNLLTNYGTFTVLKQPSAMLYLDDTYYYAGKRYERGLLCDVLVSKRTDYNLTAVAGINAEYLVFEYYFLDITQVDESSDQDEITVPVSLHISSPQNNFSAIYQFFDFDSKPHKNAFDVSECFKGNDIKYFSIKFSYPSGVDQDSFTLFYDRLLEKPFYDEIYEAIKIYSASPLRLGRTRFQALKNEFTIHTSIHNYPDPIYHFKKEGTSRVSFPKVKRGIKSNSAENCAFVCLNDTVYTDLKDYKCFSFDVCPDPSGQFFCSFYNYSLSTDPGVVLESAPECDHYSKVTPNFDSADVSSLFRRIEEKVIRGKFEIHIKDSNQANVLSFKAIDIFETNIQKEDQGFINQATTFFNQFVSGGGFDINETLIQQSNKTIYWHQRKGASLEECSRLCLFEPQFVCNLMSYSQTFLDCKWSSLPYPRDLDSEDTTVYISQRDQYQLYIRNPLSNYVEYPFKVTSLFNYKVVEADDASMCASLCSSNQEIKCRSFNLCKKNQDDEKYSCYLSETNLANPGKNPNLTETVLCSHYSRKAINDYDEIPKIQLGVAATSVIANTSIERCAEACSSEDNYLCRSFDYLLDSSACYLYKENLKDKIYKDLKVKTNDMSTHFSRLYYEKDGKLRMIEAVKPSSDYKFGGGTIFGIVFTVIVGGFLLGMMSAFVYLRLKYKKADLFPVMSFKNPNFKGGDAADAN